MLMKYKDFKQMSIDEMKNVKGGLAAGGEGGGRCYNCNCTTTGSSSCWYTTSTTPMSLCERVYPHCTEMQGDELSSCSGCTMN